MGTIPKLPSVSIIVLASTIIVLGRMTFTNNSVDEQIEDFAISRRGGLAMYCGIFFILVSFENVPEKMVSLLKVYDFTLQ